jgi:hypothetical protein
VTIEKKILIGLEDISAVVFECPKCHARVTRSPEKAGETPHICGECRTEFISPLSAREGAIWQFLRALSTLRKYESEAGFIVRFELDGSSIEKEKA